MTNYYVPLHVHSMFSLLDGLSTPEQIANRTREIGSPCVALTDHGSISGTIQFIKAMKGDKEKKEKDLKPILGVELYVCDQCATIKKKDNRPLLHMVILAKNDAGWKQLIELISESNKPEHFYYKPRLSLEQLKSFVKENMIGISGHMGSHMANVYQNTKGDYQEKISKGVELAKRLGGMFAPDHFFLEIQLVDSENDSRHKDIAKFIREIGIQTGYKCVATPDAHYCQHEDSYDQRILLCSNLHKTLDEVYNADEIPMECFFKSDNWHLPTYDEMIKYGNTPEELANTVLVANMCSEYKEILAEPMLPTFKCPPDFSSDSYLRQLCRDGWREKIAENISKNQHTIYADRVKHELKVLQGAGLSDYFLIVKDIIDFVKSKNWLVGPGRGSAAGCLVSYLIGITQVDPIKYDLLFERFYNEGRATKGRISLPDIDIDIPQCARSAVIKYLKDTYGHQNISNMVTLQTLKGRGAIKAVLRAYGNISFEEMNNITACIPDEAKISDKLQQMDNPSIIKWALENDNSKKLRPWCYIDDNGDLAGPLNKRFEQAIRLEGTKTAYSQHAAGIVISPTNLNSVCPMVYDAKSESQIAGFEMNDLESIGMVKFDLLCLSYLDKIMGVASILKTGDILIGDIQDVQS